MFFTIYVVRRSDKMKCCILFTLRGVLFKITMTKWWPGVQTFTQLTWLQALYPGPARNNIKTKFTHEHDHLIGSVGIIMYLLTLVVPSRIYNTPLPSSIIILCFLSLFTGFVLLPFHVSNINVLLRPRGFWFVSDSFHLVVSKKNVRFTLEMS